MSDQDLFIWHSIVAATVRICIETRRETPILQPRLPYRRHVLVTLSQHRQLVTDIIQTAQNTRVRLYKSVDTVLYPCRSTKLLDQRLKLSQIVSWNPGKQMMDGLKLQSPVYPVEPGRTRNIHGDTQLALGKRLVVAQVTRRHSPMRERNLHM